MADKRDQWADPLAANHSGWLTGFLADETKFDRRMLWRLGSWGVAAVGAVVVAVLASQSQIQLRRDQFAAFDMLARQSEQIQSIARDTKAENRRLTLAIETLGSDRDRLYTRVTSMEQGLEAATGSIKRQVQASATPAPPAAAPTPTPPLAATAPAPAPTTVADATPAQKPPAELPTIPVTPAPASPPAPAIGPVASKAPVETPASPPASAPPVDSLSPAMVAWKSMMSPMSDKDAAAAQPADIPASPAGAETTASISPMPAAPSPETAPTPVAHTEFGVDIGGANSVDGLRAIWRGAAKSKPLDGLRPIMMVKERGTGLGMQLRLIAGPVTDAAAAARICAALTEGGRSCETTVFDGQRLALKSEPAPAGPVAKPKAAAVPAAAPLAATVTHRALRPITSRRAAPKTEQRSEPASKPAEETAAPSPKPQSSLTTFLGMN